METITIEARDGKINEYGTERISVKRCDYQPGDLSKFAPHGCGIYGYQPQISPFSLAPQQDGNGGIIFFEAESNETFLTKLGYGLQLMDVDINKNDFSVFCQKSENPKDEGFLTQIRFVSKFASRHHFNAITETEYDTFKNQDLKLLEFIMWFINKEIDKWGNSCFKNKGLWGLFGGDGHFAKEQLCFGFMVENNYYGIYRLWSRAWLVTK